MDPFEADPTARITNQRRSALATAYAYQQLYGFPIASASVGAMLAYHDTLPGPSGAPATTLPQATPGRALLVAAHYNAVEDFDGATVDELVTNVPTLNAGDAAAALRFLGFSP